MNEAHRVAKEARMRRRAEEMKAKERIKADVLAEEMLAEANKRFGIEQTMDMQQCDVLFCKAMGIEYYGDSFRNWEEEYLDAHGYYELIG